MSSIRDRRDYKCTECPVALNPDSTTNPRLRERRPSTHYGGAEIRSCHSTLLDALDNTSLRVIEHELCSGRRRRDVGLIGVLPGVSIAAPHRLRDFRIDGAGR